MIFLWPCAKPRPCASSGISNASTKSANPFCHSCATTCAMIFRLGGMCFLLPWRVCFAALNDGLQECVSNHTYSRVNVFHETGKPLFQMGKDETHSKGSSGNKNLALFHCTDWLRRVPKGRGNIQTTKTTIHLFCCALVALATEDVLHWRCLKPPNPGMMILKQSNSWKHLTYQKFTRAPLISVNH